MRSRASALVKLLRLVSLWLAAGWGVGGCSGSHEPAQIPPTSPRASIAPTTNVPALLGKSIDGLRSKLGAAQAPLLAYKDPLQDLASSPEAEADSLAAFRTGGLTLVASYNARTRRVRDLLILGRHEDSLMARASLQPSSRNYLILPVFYANRPNHLIGLRVINTEPN